MKQDKRNARDWSNWAGTFADPAAEPEIFATLPGWRQREVQFLRAARAEGREPSPEEVRRVIEGDTSRLTIMVPDTVTLPSLRSRSQLLPGPASLLDELRPAVTREELLHHCTSFGEGKRLSSEKPRHGLFAFIWILTLIRRGQLEACPITYLWEAEEGIEQITHRRVDAWRTPLLIGWLESQAGILMNAVA